MTFIYGISVVTNVGLIFVAYALFSYGVCYTSCTNYWFLLLIAPFCVPLWVSVAALVRRKRNLPFRKFHVQILGACGALIVLLVFAVIGTSQSPSVADILTGLPAIYAAITKPDLI